MVGSNTLLTPTGDGTSAPVLPESTMALVRVMSPDTASIVSVAVQLPTVMGPVPSASGCAASTVPW
ncbi:MAG: hypothetical protein BWX68_02909 [Verrucomicrobia bacterium ADurb.Bin063]|nr:MAG: hypothetical protein BWX68_02909 [Verrucomicrobia bacterium ADurb.Bin063]